jgi:hypothetical protein
MAQGNLFQREPALVIGSLVTAAVFAFAKWRGVDTGTVLVQAGAVLAAFTAVRAKVTPYVEGALGKVKDARARLDKDNDLF